MGARTVTIAPSTGQGPVRTISGGFMLVPYASGLRLQERTHARTARLPRPGAQGSRAGTLRASADNDTGAALWPWCQPIV